jgi:hypothetical protein
MTNGEKKLAILHERIREQHEAKKKRKQNKPGTVMFTCSFIPQEFFFHPGT